MGFISGISWTSSPNTSLSLSSNNNSTIRPTQEPQSEITLSGNLEIAEKDALNLNEALEQEKSLSINYQLMLAIARQNKEAETDNVSAESNKTSQFTIEIEQSSNFEGQLTEINSSAFNLSELSLTASNQSTLSLSIISEEPELSDPLILKLSGADFKFNSNHKINFDLNADGKLDRFNNLTGNSAFLAFDKNNNGFIDDGSEFFGDTRGAKDGFADLAQYDSNNNQQIDANDHIFKSLLLVKFNYKGEQIVNSLNSHNIKSLSLNALTQNKAYEGKNLLVSKSNFTRNDGSLGVVGDFLLSIR